MKPSFCASCLAEDRQLVRSRRDGRDYWLCLACEHEHPRSGRYSFGGGREDGPADHRTPGSAGKKGAS